MKSSPDPILATAARALAIGLAVVQLTVVGCSSNKEAEVDNSFDTGGGDPYADTRRSLGLDYQVDPETGMMSGEGKEAFSRGSYFGESGPKSANVGKYTSRENTDLLRSKQFETSYSKLSDEKSRNDGESFFSEAFRFSDRSARQQGQAARVTESEYGGVKVPANPYRESKKMMDSESYYAATRAQTQGDNRPSDQKIRNDQPGDGGVNMRSTDEMTVEDVRTLLNKN